MQQVLILRGEIGTHEPGKTLLVASNLRRAMATASIGLQDRMQRLNEQMQIWSCCQEVSRNIDTYALAGPNEVPDLSDVQTKGDGTPRDVSVNGSKVPYPLVVDAMFRNQDFMPRTNQFKLQEKPHLYDPNDKKQDSMFNQMPYFPALNMGFDVIRNSGNTDISIAAAGGRYEE